MGTGVHVVPASVLIDRELACQTGRSLREWAYEHGMSIDMVRSVLDGRIRNETILMELAATLGVSPASLCVAA